MGWNVKRISIVAGVAALIAEAGLNNGLVAGLIYTGASAVTAPALVKGVQIAHDAAEARLDADRMRHAGQRAHGRHVGHVAADAGDADQPARASDGAAEDSPDMPRRLGPMLVQRRAFFQSYGEDAARTAGILPIVDKMLKDDRRALQSFGRRSVSEPVWGAVHRQDIAELQAMDMRLAALRAKIGP